MADPRPTLALAVEQHPALVLDVNPDAYLKLPLFSASTAKRLIQSSPLKAFDAWQRQQEDEADEELSEDQQKRRDRGSILHHLVLGKGKRIVPIPMSEFGKNGAWTDKARAIRDQARKDGHAPLKEVEHEALLGTAQAIKTSIYRAGHYLDGVSEVAVEWGEPTPHGEVRCKAMMDHAIVWERTSSGGGPGGLIYELKIVDDAHPDRCERSASSLGYQIAAAAYIRALTALHPRLAGRIEFWFLFCEARRPYDIWAPKPSGHHRSIGERQWLRAVRRWAAGHATGEWPGYSSMNRTEIEPTVWLQQQEGLTSDEF